MLRKLIALAVAGIVAAPAFAQSNVTVYGRVDYGYQSLNGTSGGVTTSTKTKGFESGIQAGSRLGFKGTEDLGNGLKAIFEIESGIQIDRDLQDTNAAATATSNAGGLFSANRHSYVGLTGNFGTVIGGRLDGVRYGIFNKYDAFAGGTVGNFTQMTAQVDRADNAVAYVSPTFGGGFNVIAAYSSHIGPDAAFFNSGTQEAAGNVGDAKLYTLNLNYNNGPISVAADYEVVKESKNAVANGKHKVTTLAGSYDFGMVKVAALWDSMKSDNLTTAGVTGTTRAIDYRDWFISATAPVMGKGLIKATYGKIDDKLAANADASKFGIGFDYSLSKRTNVYVDYAKISNKNAANYQITAAANARPTGATGAVKGFDVGIAHKF